MCMKVTELSSKFLLLELHTLDLLKNVNKITLLLLFVQNDKSTKTNWQ